MNGETASKATLLRIEHIRECVRLSQTLSFTQTAREFLTTQPVLSKHIAGIESELGSAIFIRGKHGVSMTKEGEAFVLDALGIVAAYDLAVQKAHQVDTGFEKILTLGYLSGTCTRFLPRVIKRLSSERPDVTLSLVCLELDETASAINSDRIDMGLTASYDGDFTLSGLYHWQPLFEDDVVLITKRDHRLANRESASVYDLSGERFACPSPRLMRRGFERMPQVLDPVRSSVHLHGNIYDLESIPLALSLGNYVQLGFRHFEQKLGTQFSYIPIDKASELGFHTGLVWKRERGSRAVRDFARSLVCEAGDSAS